jgi:hypothetical protein
MINKLRDSNGDARLYFHDGSSLPVHICRVEQHFREPTEFTGHVLDYMSQGIHVDTKLVGGDPFDIRDVIFNDPATIVLWADGTKTVVKCQEDDVYSEEVGLALCFAKKALGNKGNFNEVFKKWIPEVQSDYVYCGTVEITQDLRSSAADALAKLAEKLRRPITPGEI